MPPTLDSERDFWAQGLRRVAGLDEVGRGAWAGPVVAGAVVLPADPPICAGLRDAGLRDSKRLTAPHRERLVPLIQSVALGAAVGMSSAAEIDAHGIVAACRLAMRRALAALAPPPQALLLDAFPLPDDPRPQRAIVRGDDTSLSIAAASVIAKVWRDAHMADLDRERPGYGFAGNKGYGTPDHRRALQELGATPLHRHSWRPVRDLHVVQLPLSSDLDA